MINYKKYIKDKDIQTREDVMKLIETNPDKLGLEFLSAISEAVNNNRTDTAAYYTDESILNQMKQNLPEINKQIVNILEPSVGIGSFLSVIIEKYKHNNKVIIDVVDIDNKSLEILKLLNKYRDIPNNIQINFLNLNYLSMKSCKKYDLIIGNPPFYNMLIKDGLNEYREKFKDNIIKNIAGLFVLKSLEMSEYIFFVLPKYILHNSEYDNVRNMISKLSVPVIIDFGEKGFKGVLIETIGLLIDTNSRPNETEVISVSRETSNVIKQVKITDDKFPTWIIYRDDFFDDIASKLEFNVFTVFRDRQITNSILSDRGSIRVLRSRNISRDGSHIIDIDGYDKYTEHHKVEKYSSYRFLMRDDVYLCPNMTYYPRVIKKDKNILVNGSIAIIMSKQYNNISESQLKYFSSKEFEVFYRIARNHSTRSLNLDKNSIFYFGLIKEA